jgi:CBS-domain-containing membrane protein
VGGVLCGAAAHFLDCRCDLRTAIVRLPQPAGHWIYVSAGAAGGAVAIALMEVLAERTTLPLLLVPFATSIVLVMGSPEAEPAQPRALAGGHIVSALVGLIVVHTVGIGPWAAATAVGLAMIAMHLTRTFHPPAGIDPLVIVINGMPWGFLLVPVAAGAVLLVLFAWLWHNAVQRGSWPLRWW